MVDLLDRIEYILLKKIREQNLGVEFLTEDVVDRMIEDAMEDCKNLGENNEQDDLLKEIGLNYLNFELAQKSGRKTCSYKKRLDKLAEKFYNL